MKTGNVAILVLVATLLVTACSDTPFDDTPSTTKSITGFAFESLAETATISEPDLTISTTLPYGTNRTSLVPTIIHTGVTVSPASGTAQDFSTPVAYTVTAEDSSSQVYVVSVTDQQASLFLRTAASYSGSSDWAAAAELDLGPSYRLADWNDVVASYNSNTLSDFLSILSAAGMVSYPSDGGAYVTHNGATTYSSGRYYFVARFNGAVPSGFLVHAQLASNTICLGSWSTSPRKILGIRK